MCVCGVCIRIAVEMTEGGGGWGVVEGGEGEIREGRSGGRIAFKSYNEKGVNWV